MWTAFSGSADRNGLVNRFMSVAVGGGFARWSRQSLEFAVGQGLAQAAGMLSGLIYVRLMPVDQYALYAMALSSMAFVSIGSDMGVSGALGYYCREHGTDWSVIQPMIAAIVKLRSVLLMFASLIVGVFLLKTAHERNLPIITVLACFGLVVGTVACQLRAGIDLGLMRFEGMQRESYYCEAAGSITRLVAALGMIVTGITTAVFALAGQLLGSLSVLAALPVFRRTRSPTNSSQPIGKDVWRAILGFAIPTLPTTIVYMAQDPLVLWFALAFGGKTPIAEAFAVGRIGAIYGLMGIFITVVVGPKFARIRDDAHFARMAGLCLSALVLLSAAATMIAYLAPSALLLLIGPKYAHLHREVVLAIVASSFNLLITFLAMVNRMRGWVRLEPLVAASQAVAIFVLASHWSFEDSANVLELMVALAGFSSFCFFTMSVLGLLMPALVKVR
jgi:O-antigen/teichoic acid export membrane protein